MFKYNFVINIFIIQTFSFDLSIYCNKQFFIIYKIIFNNYGVVSSKVILVCAKLVTVLLKYSCDVAKNAGIVKFVFKYLASLFEVARKIPERPSKDVLVPIILRSFNSLNVTLLPAALTTNAVLAYLLIVSNLGPAYAQPCFTSTPSISLLTLLV